MKKAWSTWAKAIGPKESESPNLVAAVRTILVVNTILCEFAIMLNVYLNHFNG